MPRVLLFTGCVNQPVSYAKAASGKGIASFFVDPDTGAAEPGPVYTDIVNPTFVALSVDGSKLAAVSETEDQAEDSLSLFAVNAVTGELTLLGRQSTRGTTACHCAFDAAGTMVAAANYTAGSKPAGNAITVHRIENGVPGPALTDIVHNGSGPNAARQERSHAHCVRWTPDQKFIAVVDLGIDSVRLYRATDFSLASETKLPAGSGPRHIVFHPHKPLAYVMSELQTGVTTLRYADGRFEILGALAAGTRRRRRLGHRDRARWHALVRRRSWQPCHCALRHRSGLRHRDLRGVDALGRRNPPRPRSGCERQIAGGRQCPRQRRAAFLAWQRRHAHAALDHRYRHPHGGGVPLAEPPRGMVVSPHLKRGGSHATWR